MAIWGGSLKYTAFFFNVLTFCYLVPPLLSLFWEKSKPMEERDRNISVNSADCVWICIVGGGQKNTKVDFQLACKLIPSSWPSHFQKHKAHLWDPPGSASSGCHFLAVNTKEIWKTQRNNPETGYFCCWP